MTEAKPKFRFVLQYIRKNRRLGTISADLGMVGCTKVLHTVDGTTDFVVPWLIDEYEIEPRRIASCLLRMRYQ